jgi:hypothetical protein
VRAAALAESLKRGACRHAWLPPDMQSLTLNAEEGCIIPRARRWCPTQDDNPPTAQHAAISAALLPLLQTAAEHQACSRLPSAGPRTHCQAGAPRHTAGHRSRTPWVLVRSPGTPHGVAAQTAAGLQQLRRHDKTYTHSNNKRAPLRLDLLAHRAGEVQPAAVANGEGDAGAACIQIGKW